MFKAVTLAELLAQLAGAELSFRREADLLGVVHLMLPAGRQILIIERVYRDGTEILLDPTPEEIELLAAATCGRFGIQSGRGFSLLRLGSGFGFGE